jgi:hypothetical protein
MMHELQIKHKYRTLLIDWYKEHNPLKLEKIETILNHYG